jgi:hypothetical protein
MGGLKLSSTGSKASQQPEPHLKFPCENASDQNDQVDNLRKMQLFASEFKDYPTFKILDEAKALSSYLKIAILRLKNEELQLHKRLINENFYHKINFLGKKFLGIDPISLKNRHLLVLNEVLEDILCGYQTLSPKKWSIETMPKASKKDSWKNLLPVCDLVKLSDELRLMNRSYIWSHNEWNRVDFQKCDLINELRRLGNVDETSLARAMLAATSHTFQTVANELKVISRYVFDIESVSFFDVQDGQVKLFSEAVGIVHEMGKEGVSHSFYALYHPQEDANHVQIRMI